ncbi:MAG: MoaD/ThiS family protein [Anaerolineaceae bacterium]|nr:MoaD/ThiS family protein [Anaerolineaceae bacterium]
MIRVILPTYLQRLANVGREVQLELDGDVTFLKLLDVIEDKYPMLKGTIRDHVTKERRAYLRFFACGQDLSHLALEMSLPQDVVNGKEPFRIVGAMSGG